MQEIAAQKLVEKRWKDRKEVWRQPDVLFRPDEYSVDVISAPAAERFIASNHYSRSTPPSRLTIGLFRKTGVDVSRLVGAAMFSVPMQKAAIPRYAGLDEEHGVELGRFVLADECAFNAESWMLAKAFAILQRMKPKIRAVVSYADPMERSTAEGVLCKPAHYGQIYQATNAVFCGRTKPRYLILDRQGQVVSERAISKIRNGECGREYATRQLIEAGAPPPHFSEDPAEWLSRVLVEPNFRKLRHPGNFAYVFGLDSEAKQLALTANKKGKPYPKAMSASAAMVDEQRKAA